MRLQQFLDAVLAKIERIGVSVSHDRPVPAGPLNPNEFLKFPIQRFSSPLAAVACSGRNDLNGLLLLFRFSCHEGDCLTRKFQTFSFPIKGIDLWVVASIARWTRYAAPMSIQFHALT